MNPAIALASCPSDLILDQVVARTRARDEFSEHLQNCETCRARLELFEAMRTHADSVVARLVQAASVQESARRQPPILDWFRRYRVPIGFALACCAAFVVAGSHFSRPFDEIEEIRVKGTSLKFFRQRGAEVVHGVSGEQFLQGDALRFVVSNGAPGHFFLVGIDAAGTVLAYHPYRGTRSVRLEPGSEIVLPGSLVLDEARGAEYFVGIFSRQPLELVQINAAMQKALAAGKLPPSSGLDLPGTHHWIVINKP